MAFVYYDPNEDKIIVAKNRGLYGIDLGELPHRMKGTETEEYSIKYFRRILISLERQHIEFLMLVYNPRPISKI